MIRSTFRRSLRLETLESRELLTAGGPSAEAQYMLEQINLARTNPSAAADLVTTNLDADVKATLTYYNVDLFVVKSELKASAPRPAVGWSDTLAATATGQSQYQADSGVQTHEGAGGVSYGQRLENAGYTGRNADGENAYAYSKSVDHAMSAFLIDWGVASKGHRNNLLQPSASPDQYYREVGIGIVSSTRPGFGPKVITQDFARRTGSKAELLGVAYNDANHNGRYDMNEGQGNVVIQAKNVGTGETKTVQTWDAGGYQIPLDPGTYDVTAKVNGSVIRSDRVSISDQNVKVDYNLTNAPVVAETPKAETSGSNGTPFTDSSWLTSWTSWRAR